MKMSSFSKLVSHNSFMTFQKYSQILKMKNMLSIRFTTCIHTSCKKSDVAKIPQTNVLVYEAPLKKRVKIVKLLSLSTSLCGFAFFPTVIYDFCKVNMFVGLAATLIASFFLSTPFMLHWITKRYVLELHYNTNSQVFTAKTYNIISQINEIKFKASDVTVPDLPGMLSSFVVQGRPLFVDANMIQDPDAYSHMMGYDKPFDLAIKLDQDESKNAS